MQPINFVYWLRGLLEDVNKLNIDKVELIKENIDIVLNPASTQFVPKVYPWVTTTNSDNTGQVPRQEYHIAGSG